MKYYLHITTELKASKVEVPENVYDIFSDSELRFFDESEVIFQDIEGLFYRLNAQHIVSIVAEAVSE